MYNYLGFNHGLYLSFGFRNASDPFFVILLTEIHIQDACYTE